jgi:hypothetical protein
MLEEITNLSLKANGTKNHYFVRKKKKDEKFFSSNQREIFSDFFKVSKSISL